MRNNTNDPTTLIVDAWLATSKDGEHWQVSRIDPPNLYYSGEAATSVGVFAWGGTEPNYDPSGLSTPFLLLHSLPLP